MIAIKRLGLFVQILLHVELHGCGELRIHGHISAGSGCLFYGPPPLKDVLENGGQEALVSGIDKVANHLRAKSRMSHPTFSLIMVRQQHPPELRVIQYIEHFLPIFGQIILSYISPTFGLKILEKWGSFAPRYEQKRFHEGFREFCL